MVIYPIDAIHLLSNWCRSLQQGKSGLKTMENIRYHFQ